MRVEFGIDRLCTNAEKYLKGKRFALLQNQSAVTTDGRYLFEALSSVGFIPVKLFAPEHGLFGTEQDQVSIPGSIDSFTGLEAVSLYGQTYEDLRPRSHDLKDIDALVVDIQDIGVRYYTYIYTMAFCIEACAKAGIAIIICDRPNPLGGVVVEGNCVHEGFESFVGAYPLAVRHALTVAEVAIFLNRLKGWNAKITVVEMKGWQRSMFYPQTQGLWVSPSPNMPTLETVLVYAGTCLFEATNVSEGRGTTRPFETVGAPFVDPTKYARTLNALKLPGVFFRPLYFKPTFHKFAGEECGGVFVHVADPQIFEAFFTGLWMVKVLNDLCPTHFDWRREPYEYVKDKLAIDILTGSAAFRRLVAEDGSLVAYRERYKEEENLFLHDSKECYLYR